MKITRPIFYFPFVIGLICFLAQTTNACRCRFGGGAPCEEYWQADTVFSGLALSSSSLPVDYGSYKTTQRLVRFTMEESFRGITSSEVEVITGWGGGDCGFQFKHGERYLVYAHRDPKTNRLAASICGRTRLLSEATEDLQYFRSLANALPGSVIFGKVVKRNYIWREGSEPFLPVRDADITIESESEERKVRSDVQGDFQVSGLKPGSYKVRLKLPPGLTGGNANDEDKDVIENDVKVENFGCVETGFYLDSDTRVTGKVVDSSGAPVPSLHLSMRVGRENTTNLNAFLSALTDKEGRFEFKRVPPGDYLLGFRILSHPDATAPHPRTYYPGVPLRAQATIISVKEGDTVKNLELRLPPQLATYEVTGTVIWADGRPAANSAIYLSLNEEEDSFSINSPAADQFGRFTLKLYEGLNYKVSAFMSKPNGPGTQSLWIDVPAKNGPRSIKLVLPDASQ